MKISDIMYEPTTNERGINMNQRKEEHWRIIPGRAIRNLNKLLGNDLMNLSMFLETYVSKLTMGHCQELLKELGLDSEEDRT